MYGGIILIEVIRHGLNFILDSRKISPLLCYNKALSCMLFSCSKLRILTAAYSLQGSLYRNCILFAVFYAINTADCIRMSLAYAFSPKSIILAICQNRTCIHAVQREHSRIPAYRNNPYMTILCGSFIHVCKMLRNSLMCIKAVHYIKPLRIFRSLLWKISSTSAAKNHNIDLSLQLLHIIYRIYLSCLSQNLNSFRSAAGKYSHQFHIRIMFNCTFYATSQVSITQNTNTNTHSLIPPMPPQAKYFVSFLQTKAIAAILFHALTV